MARWKKIIHHHLRISDRTPSEWRRLAVACLIGFVIGVATIRGFGRGSSVAQNSDDSDATIERIYVNTQ
jgi:hypothetical protein